MVHSEELIVAQERNRLAREMHDSLGHQLTVSSVQLEGAQRLITDDPHRAADIVDTVRTQIRDALSELRTTVATLRQPLQSDLSIVSALKQLGAGFEDATEIQTRLVVVGEYIDIPDAHRNVIYRATQEALTNVHRHANASNVSIRLDCGQPNVVHLTISDNGVGFPSQPELKGYGLQGLKERVAILHGELDFLEVPDGGACVQIKLPIDEGLNDE
jgi:signal transduction histidine kinase